MPRQGLVKATENDYAIILLDIKMPNMDGIQFLERLREKKPDVPVLIITGYPSIPNAAAAMRLGACDYVTKPFTSEEVTWAMQRVLNMQHVLNDEGETVAQEREAVVAAMANIETLFWDESWVQLAVDGSALVGAALPGLHGASITGIRMPKIGEVVYQGLPLAGVSVSGKPMLIIPSPISGVVAEVNSLVAHRPQILGKRSLRGRLDRRHLRHAARGNGELQAAAPGPGQFGSLLGRRASAEAHGLGLPGRKGRRTRTSCSPALAENGERVVFLDAASLGEEGPGLVERINRQAPHARIVVVGSAGGAREAAYRKHKLFYYAVEPFADNEIADILMGVFRTRREVQPGQDRTPQRAFGADQQHLDHQPQPAQGPVVGSPGAALGQRGARAADRAEAAGPDVSGRRYSRRNATHSGQHPQGGRGLRSGHGAPGPRQRPAARRTGPRHQTGLRRGAGRPAGEVPERRARWRCSRCSRTNWVASPASTPGPSPPWRTISFGTWRRTDEP